MPPRSVTFYFENRRLRGAEGEPVAKALFQAGIRTLSYSVKYKRPRGVHCARGRCVMCHMEVDGVPGVPTCILPLREGMRVRREGFRPFFAPLLVAGVRMLPFPAGFYYRMFTRPAFVRRMFLATLRRMAGVGRVRVDRPARDKAAPSASLKSAYDVIVVGAGLSGMAAALSAAERGAQVLLVDEYLRPGGHSIGALPDPEAARERDRLVTAVRGQRAVTFCPGTTAQAFYAPDRLLLGPGGAAGGSPTAAHATPATDAGTGGGLITVRGATIIFATGAYDLVPLFANSDMPGVFGLRAMRLLLERDAWRPGARAVVFGTGAGLEEATALLAAHDITVAAVVDAADRLDAARPSWHGAAYHGSCRASEASGRDWLSSIEFEERSGGRRFTIDCDLLCTAFAGQGAYELAYQAGFQFELSSDAVDENRVMAPRENYLETGGASYFVVGELAGVRGWRDKIASGERAGGLAAGTPGIAGLE